MSADENIFIVRRMVDELNKGNLDIMDEVCGSQYVYHFTENRDWDLQRIKKAMAMMLIAFPKWKITIEDIFAADDKCAYRLTCQGTHLGELWGAQPTGKLMTWTAMLIDRFEDGKIVEEWEIIDFLGLRRQLGLIPEPEKVKG